MNMDREGEEYGGFIVSDFRFASCIITARTCKDVACENAEEAGFQFRFRESPGAAWSAWRVSPPGGLVTLGYIDAYEIYVPSDATAKINGIISAKRGQILGFDNRPGWAGWDAVNAQIPESEISNLIVEIRSATAGSGTFKAEFDHLAELTGRLADQVVQARADENE